MGVTEQWIEYIEFEDTIAREVPWMSLEDVPSLTTATCWVVGFVIEVKDTIHVVSLASPDKYKFLNKEYK